MSDGPYADPNRIRGYHAHVYYAPETRPLAQSVRDGIAAAFSGAELGRWHDVPVGPHPQAMYLVAIEAALLPAFLPWLMLNRRGLTVLFHPETGDYVADHTAHAAWLGAVLPLNLAALVG